MVNVENMLLKLENITKTCKNMRWIIFSIFFFFGSESNL